MAASAAISASFALQVLPEVGRLERAELGVGVVGDPEPVDGGLERLDGFAGVRVFRHVEPGRPFLAEGGDVGGQEQVERDFVDAPQERNAVLELAHAAAEDRRAVLERHDRHDAERVLGDDVGLPTRAAVRTSPSSTNPPGSSGSLSAAVQR